jgi:hypothetical protein
VFDLPAAHLCFEVAVEDAMDAHVAITLPVLRKGAGGKNRVRRLQHMLNDLVGHGEVGHPVEPLSGSGIFGPRTEEFVKVFQRLQPGVLDATGIVESETWTKLLTQWLSGIEAS